MSEKSTSSTNGAARDVVVIGGSAGAINALTTIVAELPPATPACVLIVVHTPSEGTDGLSGILERVSSLPVSVARNHDPIAQGRIYVARPDFHLIVTASGLRVVHGPRENGFRPAIDPLFRTAARQFGPRVLGVILSGALSDGVYGLSMVKLHGGLTLVQDPDDAIISNMPANAINAVDVDYVRRAADIGPTIARLSTNGAHIEERTDSGGQQMASSDDLEPQLPVENTEVVESTKRFGPPSALTCPDCGGALWEVEDGQLVRYQCHVGHQYAPDVLESEQRGAVDNALWSAVRVLEEHADLKGRLAKQAAEKGLQQVSEGFAEGAREAHGQAQTIRSVLFAAAGSTSAATSPEAEAAATKPAPQAEEQPAKRSSVRRPARSRTARQKRPDNFTRARRRN